MRYLQEIILSLTLGMLALEIIPIYGEMVSGLFGEVGEGLAFAQRRI